MLVGWSEVFQHLLTWGERSIEIYLQLALTLMKVDPTRGARCDMKKVETFASLMYCEAAQAVQ